mmetsp:Transcript_140029/g.390317  ORF Transcript_140029/g.390317 Transcript_140029/m.390317 type:complete len:238 (-) Transcript_140029:959-1672(-)
MLHPVLGPAARSHVGTELRQAPGVREAREELLQLVRKLLGFLEDQAVVPVLHELVQALEVYGTDRQGGAKHIQDLHWQVQSAAAAVQAHPNITRAQQLGVVGCLQPHRLDPHLLQPHPRHASLIHRTLRPLACHYAQDAREAGVALDPAVQVGEGLEQHAEVFILCPARGAHYQGGPVWPHAHGAVGPPYGEECPPRRAAGPAPRVRPQRVRQARSVLLPRLGLLAQPQEKLVHFFQ